MYSYDKISYPVDSDDSDDSDSDDGNTSGSDNLTNDEESIDKVRNEDTEMVINAVIDHNHIWDLGIQLDRYKQQTPGLTQTNYKRFNYVSSCPWDKYHDNW